MYNRCKAFIIKDADPFRSAMKAGPSLILFFLFAAGAFAQSARVKPTPAPTPNGKNRPPITYHPTEPMSPVGGVPAASPTPAAKADDDDVIRIESTLVPIPVSIVDMGGRAVTDLKLTDFQLSVAGRPAEISDLARSESPIRLAMLFDNSGSVLAARDFEKVAAVKFFRSVIRPELDLAALFSIATVSRLEQPFTKDVSQLTSAIEAFPPPIGATALLDGLVRASLYLTGIPGRRVIIIVSDGDDTASDSTFEDTLKALQVADCQVFIVKTTDFENFKRTGSRIGNANIRQLAAERRMQEIAAQTGGAVYSPLDEKELDEAFRRISAELSQQFVLSYYPDAETQKSGEFRDIALSVKSRPNLLVRTRKGYYVPKK